MTVQYLKHYYVSAIDNSIILTDTNNVQGGKMHPAVENLHVEMQLQDENGIDYCLSTAEPDLEIDVAGVTVLTEEEWKAELENAFNNIKQNQIKAIYLEYKDKFENLPDEFYHPYEMLYSNYIKRVEAATLNSDMTIEQAKNSAPTIAIEAEKRGIGIFILAQKILDHAYQFDNAQANLLASRGQKVDKINAIVCDTTSIEAIKNSIALLTARPEEMQQL